MHEQVNSPRDELNAHIDHKGSVAWALRSLSVSLRATVLGISWTIKEGLKHQGVDYHQKNAGSNNMTGVSTKSFTLPHLCTRECRANLK